MSPDNPGGQQAALTCVQTPAHPGPDRRVRAQSFPAPLPWLSQPTAHPPVPTHQHPLQRAQRAAGYGAKAGSVCVGCYYGAKAGSVCVGCCYGVKAGSVCLGCYYGVKAGSVCMGCY